MRGPLRRCVSVICAALGLGIAAANGALAQERPAARNLTILVPTAAGGGQDIIARIVANHLTKILGNQVIVENRTGANGIIAAGLLLKAKPDGNTLMVNGPQWGALTNHFRKPPFDADKDIVAVATLAGGPNVLVTGPGQQFTRVEDLVAHDKKHPGKLTYATNGVGSGQHLAWELFNHMAGTNLKHVPFKGSGEYLTQISGDHIAFGFSSILSSAPLVQAGKLKALAVTTPVRHESLPNVPAVAEYKPLASFKHINWNVLFAPAKVPSAVLDTINKSIAETLAHAPTAQAIKDRGNDAAIMSVAEAQEFVRNEQRVIMKVVHERNIQINL